MAAGVHMQVARVVNATARRRAWTTTTLAAVLLAVVVLLLVVLALESTLDGEVRSAAVDIEYGDEASSVTTILEGSPFGIPLRADGDATQVVASGVATSVVEPASSDPGDAAVVPPRAERPRGGGTGGGGTGGGGATGPTPRTPTPAAPSPTTPAPPAPTTTAPSSPTTTAPAPDGTRPKPEPVTNVAPPPSVDPTPVIDPRPGSFLQVKLASIISVGRRDDPLLAIARRDDPLLTVGPLPGMSAAVGTSDIEASLPLLGDVSINRR